MRLMTVILIVEDDMLICELAGMMMQDWGYCIRSANDVDEALEFLRSPQKIDVLFTDIYLKKAVYGGCELAQQAILLRPSLRVLYTTGNAITDKLKSLFVEGSLFLRKPYTVNQLQQSMAHALAV
jgi:DNA-binding NtrC family response regulator